MNEAKECCVGGNSEPPIMLLYLCLRPVEDLCFAAKGFYLPSVSSIQHDKKEKLSLISGSVSFYPSM